MRSKLVVSSLAVIALVCASPTFAQQAPAGTSPNGTMPQTQTPAHGQMAMPRQAQKQKLSEKDRNFAKEAALGGMAEVELGRLAHQNAQHDDVKQFGARMVRDHSAANQKLETILAAKDMTVPRQLDEKHHKTVDRLSKMRGAEFDRAYMREMVEDHNKDVKKFHQEAQHGNDADLKSFAQSTLPVLEEHQKLAHEISRSLTAVGSTREPQRQRNR
jgi:putative membrane protein